MNGWLNKKLSRIIFFYLVDLTWLLSFKLPINPIDQDVITEIPKPAEVVDAFTNTTSRRRTPRRLTRAPRVFDHHMLKLGSGSAKKRPPKKTKKSPKFGKPNNKTPASGTAAASVISRQDLYIYMIPWQLT